ncbi:MAG: hypothetical protein IJ737_01965 [Ruminococcus sp.]|nr:hypothetical protein [Ruminococcus sp.]
MDLLDTMVYTLARIGLMLALIVFGAFAGEVILPGAASFLPDSMLGLKEFLVNDTVQSVNSMLVVSLFFLWVFFDDGRRHTAYENWSYTNIIIVVICMFIMYFIPAIFRDSFHEEGKLDFVYMVLYYPAAWAIGAVKDYLSGIVVATAVMLVFAAAAYIVSFKLYTKKHPSIIEQRKRSLLEAAKELEEDELDEYDEFDDFDYDDEDVDEDFD